jgi:hypothetical protein
MILKISPADVVSIPSDYNGAKGRCMRYEVVAEVGGDPAEAFAEAVNSDYTPKTELHPAAAWPFAVGQNPNYDDEPEFTDDDFDPAGLDDDELFSVVRVYGGDIVAEGVTLEEAEAMVEKNIRQKKAQLMILDENGDEV